MAESSLAERKESVAKDIGARFAATVERALTIMEVVSTTNELPRREMPVLNKEGDQVGVMVELVRPNSMSDAVFHIHQDAMKSEREAPFYLKVARGRVDLAHRIAGDRSNAPQAIAALVVRKLDLPKREYPVLDITEVKK